VPQTPSSKGKAYCPWSQLYQAVKQPAVGNSPTFGHAPFLASSWPWPAKHAVSVRPRGSRAQARRGDPPGTRELVA
jgi:hypothetical protein